MKKLLLIDGNNLLYRAYHAMPFLTDRNGEMANAVYGFSNMLLKAIDEVKPDYLACAFDTAMPTFRHVAFEKYKAQRSAPPPDLYPQLPKVKRVLAAFGIPYFEKEGYEADDVIATLATQALRQTTKDERRKQSKKQSLDFSHSSLVVIILSGDRDVLQLVDGNIKVQMPGWNLNGTTLYGAKEVQEKFGLEPHQMVDYKSLVGDPSDNIPGVVGIGPKGAAALLQKYHTLENLYEHIDEVDLKFGDKLRVGKDIALEAKKLVELDRDIDLKFGFSKENFSIGNLKFEPNWEKVTREFEELGFKSIAAKVSGGIEDTSQKVNALPAKSKATLSKSNQLELV